MSQKNNYYVEPVPEVTPAEPVPQYHITQTMLERLLNDFSYHQPIAGQPARYEQIRAAAHELAVFLCERTPPSREQSMALTNLDQVVFWANAAIARNE